MKGLLKRKQSKNALKLKSLRKRKRRKKE